MRRKILKSTLNTSSGFVWTTQAGSR